eukprot:31188-Pelagococcus_subviridis.AAC.6
MMRRYRRAATRRKRHSATTGALSYSSPRSVQHAPDARPSLASSISLRWTPFRCAAPRTATTVPTPAPAVSPLPAASRAFAASTHVSRMLRDSTSFLVARSAFRNRLLRNTTSKTSKTKKRIDTADSSADGRF